MFWIQDYVGNYIDAEKIESFYLTRHQSAHHYIIEARSSGHVYVIKPLTDVKYSRSGNGAYYDQSIAIQGLEEYMKDLFAHGFGQK